MNTEYPIISIIIVNYNGKKWLKKCLDSLESQTFKEFEIIVVDNNSTDESVPFLNNTYPKIVVVRSDKNLGFAGSNNLGIDKAKGDLILLLNNDTWVEVDFLEKLLIEFGSSNSDVVAPYETEYENPTFKKSYATIDLLGHPINQKPSNNKSSKTFYLTGACLLFKKDLYRKSGGLDNDFFMYMEETDWFWRLHLANKRIHRIDNLFFYHAGGGSTGKGIKYNVFLWRNQNTLQMLIKNYRAFNLLWVIPLYFLQNIFEILFFFILLKPKIALSYLEGWQFNILHLKQTLEKRKIVQKYRIVGDWTIMKKMYWGPGKLYHLVQFYITKQYE